MKLITTHMFTIYKEMYGLSTDGGKTYNPYHEKHLTLEQAQKVCDELNTSPAWRNSKKRPHFTPVKLQRDEENLNTWYVC